jgi:hypothetical protein
MTMIDFYHSKTTNRHTMDGSLVSAILENDFVELISRSFDEEIDWEARRYVSSVNTLIYLSFLCFFLSYLLSLSIYSLYIYIYSYFGLE